MPPAIQVDRVSKKFARSLKRAMVYGLVDITKAALIPHRFRSPLLEARLRDDANEEEKSAAAATQVAQADNQSSTVSSPPLRPSEFWALRNVSFTVSPGECVGLVGHNGAGKSTLFSILSGIYGPTEGRVTLRGRLQALIALGAGFHPSLTGRENIFINAAILGLKEKEIQRLLPKIIEFSEIPEFIDSPVRTYSSGMMVRLGFSVAAHLSPDILLVDEVLAVGDSRFQTKCQDHMRKVMNSGVAVMLVSHFMQNIQGTCSRAIWMNRGELMMDGDVMDVTTAYQRHLYESGSLQNIKEKESSGGFSAYIEAVAVMDENDHAVTKIQSGEGVDVLVNVYSSSAFECGRPYILLRAEGRTEILFSANMLEEGQGIRIEKGLNPIRLRIPHLPLREGRYVFYACVRSRDGVTALSNGCLSAPLEVLRAMSPAGKLPIVTGGLQGLLHVPFEWMIDADRKVET